MVPHRKLIQATSEVCTWCSGWIKYLIVHQFRPIFLPWNKQNWLMESHIIKGKWAGLTFICILHPFDLENTYIDSHLPVWYNSTCYISVAVFFCIHRGIVLAFLQKNPTFSNKIGLWKCIQYKKYSFKFCCNNNYTPGSSILYFSFIRLMLIFVH